MLFIHTCILLVASDTIKYAFDTAAKLFIKL